MNQKVQIEMTLEQAANIFDILIHWQDLNKKWLEHEKEYPSEYHETNVSLYNLRYEESKELLGLFYDASQQYENLEDDNEPVKLVKIKMDIGEDYVVNKTQMVEMINYNGVKITDLTIDEFNLLTKLVEELSPVEIYKSQLDTNQRDKIHESLIDLIDPTSAGYEPLPNGEEGYLNDYEMGLIKSLYEKLKNVTVDEAVNIFDAIYKAMDSFLYMFRF